MPMGTDPISVPTDAPPADPRDALIASLQAQLQQLQATTPVASLQSDVKAAEVAVAPVVRQVESDVKADASVAASDLKTAAENEFTHFLHLADGRVMKLVGTVTHWFDSDQPGTPGVPVIGVYPKQ